MLAYFLKIFYCKQKAVRSIGRLFVLENQKLSGVCSARALILSISKCQNRKEYKR